LTENQYHMEIKKEKLSKRKDTCFRYAESILKTSPSLSQLEEFLNELWCTAYAEGYIDKSEDIKKVKDSKEKLLLQKFNVLRDHVEDIINQNK
jgi:hypothetical protein